MPGWGRAAPSAWERCPATSRSRSNACSKCNPASDLEKLTGFGQTCTQDGLRERLNRLTTALRCHQYDSAAHFRMGLGRVRIENQHPRIQRVGQAKGFPGACGEVDFPAQPAKIPSET